MIDNKYYRPTIDEIYNSPDLYYTSDGDIENGVFLNPFYYRDKNTSFDLRESCGINNCVVKYLDKEDIESVGFQQLSLPYQFKKDWYTLVCRQEEHQYIVEDGRNCDQIFVGTIKNKSELIKLLKMLNIQ